MEGGVGGGGRITSYPERVAGGVLEGGGQFGAKLGDNAFYLPGLQLTKVKFWGDVVTGRGGTGGVRENDERYWRESYKLEMRHEGESVREGRK